MIIEPKLMTEDEIDAIDSANDIVHPYAWSPDHMADEHYRLAEQAVGDIPRLLAHIAALQARLSAERRAREEDAREAADTLAFATTEQGKLATALRTIGAELLPEQSTWTCADLVAAAQRTTAAIAAANHSIDDCTRRGAALVAERDRYRRDFVAMSDRAAELAARVSELESQSTKEGSNA